MSPLSALNLTARERLTLAALLFDGKSLAAVAKAFGVSRQAIKKRCQRARRRARGQNVHIPYARRKRQTCRALSLALAA